MQMKESTRTLFKQTVQALCEIGLLYEQMYQLFRDDHRVSNLLSTDPNLFDSIRRCFIDSIIIKLVQLCDTDPDSVSFCNLRKNLESEYSNTESHRKLLQDLNKHGAKIWENIEELKKVRNARIGHLSQNALSNGLFATSQNKWIKDSMNEMDEFLIIIRSRFDGCDRSYIKRESYSLQIDRFHEILEKGLQ